MGKRSSLKSKSGRRELNPTDAFRKQQRNREKKRNKNERQKVREEATLRRNPTLIQQELNDLKHKELLGQVDVKSRKRLEYLELLWLTVEQRMHAEQTPDKLCGLGIDPLLGSDPGSSSESENSDGECLQTQSRPAGPTVAATEDRGSHLLASHDAEPPTAAPQDIPLPTDLLPEDIPLPTDMTSDIPLPSDLQDIPLPSATQPHIHTAFRPPLPPMMYGGYAPVPYWMVGLPVPGANNPPLPQATPDSRADGLLGSSVLHRISDQRGGLRMGGVADYSDSSGNRQPPPNASTATSLIDYPSSLQATSAYTQSEEVTSSSRQIMPIGTVGKVGTKSKSSPVVQSKNMKALFVPTRLRVQKPLSTTVASTARGVSSSLSTVSTYALGADRAKESAHTMTVTSVVGMPKALANKVDTQIGSSATKGVTTAEMDAAFASFLREVND